MIKSALLKVKILDYNIHLQRYDVRGELFDGSEFDINVPYNTISHFPGENVQERAWLRVEHHGEQNDKSGVSSGVCAVVLPSPHIKYGARVNVATKHVELDVQKVDTSRTSPPRDNPVASVNQVKVTKSTKTTKKKPAKK